MLFLILCPIPFYDLKRDPPIELQHILLLSIDSEGMKEDHMCIQESERGRITSNTWGLEKKTKPFGYRLFVLWLWASTVISTLPACFYGKYLVISR